MKKLFFALAIFLSLTSLSFAAVEVGDKPQLSFHAVDGTPISLANLRGKIVVVDFWATWCEPCMAEADHMVSLNEQYQSKGVRLLGISLDSNRSTMIKTAKEKGFTWPQYFDGKVWKNDIGVEWGVGSIPSTFIIGPDGEVLWKGPLAEIDKVLEKTLKDHPPRLLDPKALAEATAALDKTESAIKSGDFAAASKLFAKIPSGTKSESTLVERFESIEKQINDYTTKLMDSAEKQVDLKEYASAIAKLRAVSRLVDLPIAAEASKRLNTILTIPEAKAQFDAADRAEKERERVARSNDALTAAQKLQAAKKDDQAYAQFKNILSSFASTPAAASAAEEIAKYEKDPAFVKHVTGAAVDSKAKSILSVADSYKASGNTDLAWQKYQSVIDQFPGTAYAETAKKELKDLN